MTLVENTVYTRIVDTGAGLCTVTRMPGPFYTVYDTGHWSHVDECVAGIREVVPAGAVMHFLVQSHSDGDHLSATDDIFDEYAVATALRTGYARWGLNVMKNWLQAQWAIRKAARDGVTTDVNIYKLATQQIQPRLHQYLR